MFRGPLLLLLALALLLMPTVAGAAPGWATFGGTARYGIPVDKLLLTPAAVWTNLERHCFTALYDTPVVVGPSGEPRPHAAVSLARNAEGSEYELTLHAGLHWSDGTAVTAGQVVAGWEWTITHHPLNAPAFTLVKGYREFAEGAAAHVEGIAVKDARTIALTLSRGELKFPSYMADPTWALCRGTAKRLTSGAVAVESMLGTGPYLVTGLEGRTCSLRRNRHHFGGVALLEKWQWQLLGSAEAVTRSYLAGGLDAAPLAATEQVQMAQQSWKGHVVENHSAGTFALLTNPASLQLGAKGQRGAFLTIPQPSLLRSGTWAGAADAAGGHFSDRFGTTDPPPAGRPGTGSATAVVLAVPAGEPDLTAAAHRIAAEAAQSGWQVTVRSREPRDLAISQRDWDAALWLLPGSVQPVLPQAAEFLTIWKRWGWSGVQRGEMAEAALVRDAYWRPLAHPRALYLRSPRLQAFLHPSRLGPDWAGAHW